MWELGRSNGLGIRSFFWSPFLHQIVIWLRMLFSNRYAPPTKWGVRMLLACVGLHIDAGTLKEVPLTGGCL